MSRKLLLKNRSQMPKIILITVLLFLSGLLVTEAETVSDENTAAKKLSEQLNENLTESPLNLKVRKLTMQGSQVSSEFADNLLRLISHELKSNTDDFHSVGELSRGITSRGLEVLPNEDEDPQAQDAFLEGSYRKVGEQVVVQIRLVGKDGTSVSRAEISLPVSGIKHELQPPNFSLVEKIEKEAAQTENPPSSDFEITLKLNKDTNFREGDRLEIFFSSDEDCYLSLLYQDVEGNHYIIYPLKGQPNRKFLAGKGHENITKPMEISCYPGCGQEMIWAFASDRPVTLPEGYVDNLSGSGLRGYQPDVSIRGILNQHRSIKLSVKKTEKKVYLTTVK